MIALVEDRDDALHLLAVAWRVNKKNVAEAEQRLAQLAEIGRELRAGRLSAEEAIARAEMLNFIAPLAADVEARHA